MWNVYVASVFSKDGKGGNKAGVVLDRPELTVQQKKAIAKELNFSETVFVTDSARADFELQYFTPAEEVPLCGHATIAAFFILRHLGRLDKNAYTIETKAGILHMQIQDNGWIFMEQTLPRYYEILPPDAPGICLDAAAFSPTLPIQIVSTGLKDILLPVDSPAHLAGLQPDFPKMSQLSREQDVVGVHAFALTGTEGITALCRNFAPLYGIDEESATGTSNCALACYLSRYFKQQPQYIFEQGHNLGDVSRIVVNLTYQDDQVASVYVGGEGYLVCEKELDI